jgi:hypothetical protein
VDMRPRASRMCSEASFSACPPRVPPRSGTPVGDLAHSGRSIHAPLAGHLASNPVLKRSLSFDGIHELHSAMIQDMMNDVRAHYMR